MGDVANQIAKVFNRFHMRRDVIDDEILNFDCSKNAIVVRGSERHKELDDRVRGFSVDDEIFLGDDEIADFFRDVLFFILRKRIDGGFEFRRR